MRPLVPSEIMVLNFMDNHGHPGYFIKIKKIEQAYEAEHAFGERDILRQEWDEVVQSAVDRYDDWASDRDY